MQLGRESGLYEYWTRKYKPNIAKCLLDHYQDKPPMMQKLTLAHLSSSLVLLLLGFSISFIMFLIELIWHRIKNDCRKINVLVGPQGATIPIVMDNHPLEGAAENNDNITNSN